MERKPAAQARRVALFEREVRYSLTQAALELLFDCAEIISEGERRGDGYFGSTMITFDLTRVAAQVRETCDAASARRFAELLATDSRVKARARQIAAADAAERAGLRLARLDTEFRARAVGTRIHFDVDVEGELARERDGELSRGRAAR